MEDSVALFDTIILVAGIALILLTSLRVSRQRAGRKPVKGQTGALVGIVVWLGCLGVALYLIFG
ncbi:MAG TPA: hypothetical protein VFX87_09385 [Methylomirabilota bacterium]|nr:hypothetical protein [Methylomirabilota bacterium]